MLYISKPFMSSLSQCSSSYTLKLAPTSLLCTKCYSSYVVYKGYSVNVSLIKMYRKLLHSFSYCQHSGSLCCIETIIDCSDCFIFANPDYIAKFFLQLEGNLSAERIVQCHNLHVLIFKCVLGVLIRFVHQFDAQS